MHEQRINLNAATAEELAKLPRIGPALAERIVSYRDTIGRFEAPTQLTSVSGIGERTYQEIADHVSVARPSEDVLPEEESTSSVETVPPGESIVEGEPPFEELKAGEVTAETAPEVDEQTEKTADEETSEPEESATEVEAAPPGESLAEEESSLEELASDETKPEAAPALDEEAEEAAEEAVPKEESTETEQKPPKEKALPEAHVASPSAEQTPGTRSSCWRRLSWLGAALLGGILGMVFALIVFGGINGSLDVGHSRAVLELESQMNGLTGDVDAVQGDVEDLQTRLDALEGLTARMERVESDMDDLDKETAALVDQTDALMQDIVSTSEELQEVSEDMVALEEQVQRTFTFFQRLQHLLEDLFDGTDTEPVATPTPTPEGK